MAASLWWDEPETSSKSENQNKEDELLVFGYACKLFRDDSKARDIDKGKLLIPWMGDERLMIDRYDGRGHLFDLATHDADNVEDKNPTLSEEDEAVEKACDEERYLELHTDLREAQIYEEEEWKRYYLSLQEGYQAVGFSYDQYNPGNDGLQQDIQLGQVKTEEEEKPFVPLEELQVPDGIETPQCKRHNARIEKTANFIAQHGIQMEIMLKTKQAGNSQFDFLHFENVLNPYYKHVVTMIKSGKYKPQEEEEEEDKDDDQGYLHPSLSSTTQLPPPPPPPSKPIELPKVSILDTPYGALIKSIKKNSELLKPPPSENQSAPLPHPYCVDYDHQPVAHHPNNPPPPGTEPVTLPLVSSLNGQEFVDQLYGQPPPPGTESDDIAPYPSKNPQRRKRSSSSDSSSSSSSSSSSRGSKKRRKGSKSRHSKAPARVEGPSQILPPPPDVQPIVDRMALYVAKNGAEFEMVVMSRKDPRFQFLNEYHAHYPYYKVKKERYLEELAKLAPEGEGQDDKSSQNNQRSVSFSIKPRPKEQESSHQAGKRKLFEYDSSEGEEEKQTKESVSEPQSGSATPTPKIIVDEDSQNSQKEMEEKLKDKLASAVKERISQTHKEKQLQLERKKKAAMFLNLLKSNQPSAPGPQLPPEDSSDLYVGEAAPAPVVYEYDNQALPQRVSRSERSRSPREKKRRRRSPTPPSAYSWDRRSPTRTSPPRWSGRPGAWSNMRDRTPPWQRRNRDLISRKSRSRSPHRKDKKKHKRSKSKTPPRREKSKEKSRHSKEKSSKHKPKEKEKKKKEKSRHRSKERDSKHSKTRPSDKDVASGNESNSSDVEVLENSPSDQTQIFSNEHEGLRNGQAEDSVGFDLSSIPVPDGGSIASSSVESVLRISKALDQSESTEDLGISNSRTTSQANSPATHTSLSRGSTPSRSSTDTTSATSTDLMSKVRAMLKKSREMILKEEGFSLEDT